MTRFLTLPRAIILDWAGCTVDHGSRAPTEVFMEIFRRRGVEITVPEARGPMGRAKDEHIADILALPRITAAWRERYGREPTPADVHEMYREFLPLQKETLSRVGSNVIPGVPEAIAKLRARGIKIGSTTGYTRELMEVVMPIAAREGYAPEVMIASDDVPMGRPAPWQIFRAAERLGVYPMTDVLVVDDTTVGIHAGLFAGAMTLAITRTGNALGLTAEEAAVLPSEELANRLARIAAEFQAAGAHATLPSVADLPEWLEPLG
jgi:phosphonoacetaldehyde hydrolase